MKIQLDNLIKGDPNVNINNNVEEKKNECSNKKEKLWNF